MDLQGSNLRDFLQTNGHVTFQRVDNSSLRYFTENELSHITNGYSTLLGNGAFGKVYKGVLENQTPVAVKRYINATRKEQFAKEVIVHSQINHKNVVRLFGCCTEENALMMVMEFISNGNLESILHCSNNNGCAPFPLDRRLDIAIQVSEVLWWMHSMYSPVLHGDIKPANILLDEHLTPKITDFGISRMLSADGAQHTQNVIGSIGYIDPAYCESGILTSKSDVYSLGVVLLEIITKKKAVDGTVVLAQYFNSAIEKGEDTLHMFDKEISAATNIKFLSDIGKLVVKCLARDVKMRPEMIDVAIILRTIKVAFMREQGNPCQQHDSVPINSVPLKDVELAAHQFGDLKIFKEAEIKRMTKKLRMPLREESCERLYYGVHGNDFPVIIRKVRTSSETETEMFLKTMSISSQKNHKNVVNVVGFHLGKSHSECVYESCCDLSKSMFGSIALSNRNLYDSICSMEELPLHQCLSIAVQCAEGLVHIHSIAAQNHDLYGTNLFGNFRSANIFLDSNFVPKVFNVNLSTFLGLSISQQNLTADLPLNNHGSAKYYLDPMDVSSHLLNRKSDVYSFGVVLLELITWKTVRYISDGRDHVLTTDFLDTCRRKCNTIGVFGKVYKEKGIGFLHQAIAIAVECLLPDSQKRPEMSHVLSCLRNIAKAQNIISSVTAGSNREPTPVNNVTKTAPTVESTISLDELNKITMDSSNDLLIGESSSNVHFGVLKNGKKCVVKKLNERPADDSLVRVQAMSRMCKHDNVLPLFGYFINGKTCIIAYEYAPNDSLHDILHAKTTKTKPLYQARWDRLQGDKGTQTPLSWTQRVKIALGAAKGLEFIHEKAEPPMIHTNIKSSNIFLFDGDVAKIGDIGTSNQMGMVCVTEALTHINYGSGYEAPEHLTYCYHDEGFREHVYGDPMKEKHSKKSDTYSFGVVMLELLTGRKAIDHTLPRKEQSLVTWFLNRQYEDKVEQYVDPALGGRYPSKVVAKFAAVAALCVQSDFAVRPEMSTVVKALSPLLRVRHG